MFNTDWDKIYFYDRINSLEKLLETAMSGKGDKEALEAWWEQRKQGLKVFKVGDRVNFSGQVFKVLEVTKSDPVEYLVEPIGNDGFKRFLTSGLLDLVDEKSI